MKITITSKDILDKRNIASMSGMLIDELAFSAGEATEDEIDPEDYATQSAVEYVSKEYNYERALLNETKSAKRLLDLCSALSDSTTVAFSFPVPKNTKHAGAYLALNEPENFALILEKYEAKCKEEAYQYYDNAFLTGYSDKSGGYAKDFAKEIQDSIDAQQTQNYKEWLHGDHRNYAGVLSLIAKYYGADEALDYDEKTGDSVVFTFDDEYLKSEMQEYADDGVDPILCTSKECKEWLISQIQSAIDSKYAKRKRDNEARKIERERLTAYKAEQQAQEDNERRTMLTKLTK